MAIPESFRHIRLHLARSKDHPAGSIQYGYDIVAPLRADGRLDVDGWKRHRDRCRVHRFWGTDRHEVGALMHRSGGAGGARWLFDYDPDTDADDEAGYRFGDHPLRVGEYLSIVDRTGKEHTFRVASVEPLPHMADEVSAGR